MIRKPHTKAALLYVLPVLAFLGVWYMLLFTKNPPAVSPVSTLRFVLMETPQANWFRWLIALPMLCIVLGVAHISRLTHSRRGSVGLLVVGAVLAIASWLTVSPEVALFVSLPLAYAFLGIKEQR